MRYTYITMCVSSGDMPSIESDSVLHCRGITYQNVFHSLFGFMSGLEFGIFNSWVHSIVDNLGGFASRYLPIYSPKLNVPRVFQW